MRTRSLATSFAVGLGFAAPWLWLSAARACSCAPPDPPTAAAQKAVAVFEGTATDFSETDWKRRYAFVVSRVFKGEVKTKLEVETAADGAMCGRAYQIGEAYLIYAHLTPDGELGDHMCTRSRPILRAHDDLRALGPGYPALDAAVDVPSGSAEPPRIESTNQPAVPPHAPKSKGCGIGEAVRHPSPLSWAGLVGWLLCAHRRRRLA